DEGAKPAAAARAVVVAPADVGRAALLPALQDQRADAAEMFALGFERRMDVVLRAVEEQRSDGAALGADAKNLAGEARIIRIEALARLRVAARGHRGAARRVERGPIRIELAERQVENAGELRQDFRPFQAPLLDRGDGLRRQRRP